MDNLKVSSYEIRNKSAEIRGAAKKLFHSNWKGICLTGFLIYLIMYIPGMVIPYFEGEAAFAAVSMIASLVMLVVFGHFIWGYSAYIMNCVDKKQSGKDALLDGFRHFGKAFCMFIIMSLKILLQVLGSVIVSGLSAYFIASLIGMVLGHGNHTYSITLILFFIAYMAACTFIMLRYVMTFYLGIDYPSAGANALSKTSALLMNGYKKKYFLLMLSTIGWWILAATVLVGLTILFTYIIEAGVFYLILLLVSMLVCAVPLSGYIMSISTVFYYLLTGKGRINEEGILVSGEEESEKGKTTEITEESGVEDFEGEKESTENKKNKTKLYVLAGILAVMTIGGGIFAAFDVNEMMGIYDDSYGDFDELEEWDDYYTDIDPESVLQRVELTDGNISMSFDNGDGWIVSTDENAYYNYMGPDEYLNHAVMVEMPYAPYDMVHLSSYSGGCTLDEVMDFVDECWYYEDDLVYSETVSIDGLDVPVTVYYDGCYYYMNLYLEQDGEVYHIYAVTDTQKEAEAYIKYINETFEII